MKQSIGQIQKNTKISDRIYQLDISLDLAGIDIAPGQFLFIRPTNGMEPLLRRPFGIMDVNGQ